MARDGKSSGSEREQRDKEPLDEELLTKVEEPAVGLSVSGDQLVNNAEKQVSGYSPTVNQSMSIELGGRPILM